jgi:hypothetical protein
MASLGHRLQDHEQMPRAPKGLKDQTNQSKAFIEAARKLGCDEDPTRFDEILKKVARHKPPSNSPPETTKPKTKKPGQ